MKTKPPVKRLLSLGLALLLAVGVAVAVVRSVQQRSPQTQPADLTVVRGLIGSEKQPFFNDPAVVAAFARHGLRLQVDVAGSRQIAQSDLSGYDFAFPAGVPAAVRIQRDHKVTKVYQPFYTPMAVATFKPIAAVLRRAGVMRPLAGGYWRFEMKAYLDLVARGARWIDLPGNRPTRPGSRC